MKDRTILAIKGLAIIGVVFHHIENRRLSPEANDLGLILCVLFNWCVLAFFCVSGYLQALSDSRKKKTLGDFIQNRVTRLIVPYLLLALFYSCIWQLIQVFHIPNIGVKVPPDFIGKLHDVLWPVDSSVAQQLYFFPLLFAVSLVVVVIQSRLGLHGMWIAALVTAGVGLRYFPGSFTGFSWGVFLWSLCFYASGYLFFHYRTKKAATRVALIAFTAFLVIFSGHDGLVRCIPLWLLCEGTLLRLERAPLLERLGETSGTIYIYHTPFIIQPLVIAATYLPGPVAQCSGVLLAATVAMGICCVLFERLKNTRAKILLM